MGLFRSSIICLIFFWSLVEILFFYQFVTYNYKGEEEKIGAINNNIHLKDLMFNSTCSRAAHHRGPRQKVIAYSIYGDFSRTEIVGKYLKPFRETIKDIPIIYPGKKNYK